MIISKEDIMKYKVEKVLKQAYNITPLYCNAAFKTT